MAPSGRGERRRPRPERPGRPLGAGAWPRPPRPRPGPGRGKRAGAAPRGGAGRSGPGAWPERPGGGAGAEPARGARRRHPRCRGRERPGRARPPAASARGQGARPGGPGAAQGRTVPAGGLRPAVVRGGLRRGAGRCSRLPRLLGVPQRCWEKSERGLSAEPGLCRGLPAAPSGSSVGSFSPGRWRSGEGQAEPGDVGEHGGVEQGAPVPAGPAGLHGLLGLPGLIFRELPLLLPGALARCDGGAGSTHPLGTPPVPQG
ncbi:uncharacterized protein LOC142403294 [Mycteria americana]|uniref:uncharacterized protein LOC142403294 n=1 Tax=Mycteria americana TaxID=33587 RepID=UPI003F5856EC